MEELRAGMLQEAPSPMVGAADESGVRQRVRMDHEQGPWAGEPLRGRKRKGVATIVTSNAAVEAQSMHAESVHQGVAADSVAQADYDMASVAPRGPHHPMVQANRPSWEQSWRGRLMDAQDENHEQLKLEFAGAKRAWAAEREHLLRQANRPSVEQARLAQLESELHQYKYWVRRLVADEEKLEAEFAEAKRAWAAERAQLLERADRVCAAQKHAAQLEDAVARLTYRAEQAEALAQTRVTMIGVMRSNNARLRDTLRASFFEVRGRVVRLTAWLGHAT